MISLHQHYLYFRKHLTALVSTVTTIYISNSYKKNRMQEEACLYLEVEPLGGPQKS